MEERYTDIRLVKVPIEIDNKNQLDFSSATTQYNYFNSCDFIELDSSSYQRKDNTCRYPGHIDDLIGYNYCMYKNSSYSDKWFYAFITDMQYVNDSMTLVSIKTDVWQTWQFDIDIKKCFVEREHVNNDTIGLHTVPEGLETGEYVVSNSESLGLFSDDIDDYIVVLGVTKLVTAPGTTPDDVGGKLYANVYSGIEYIVSDSFTDTDNLIKTYAKQGISDSIISAFMVPKSLIGFSSLTFTTVASWSWVVKYARLSDLDVYGLSTLGYNKPTKLYDNYTPKNNKMLTFPFTYLNVDNNVGNCLTYHFEDFSGNKAIFDIEGTLTPGCSYKIAPHNYKNVTSNWLYSFVPSKLPICNWQDDLFTNWMTQNGVNIPLKVAGSGIAIAAGAITANPIAIASGILGIAGSMGEVYQHSFIPPSIEGNTNSADITFASGLHDPILYTMSIKKEYAEIIDNYFSMFGYKVNSVKIPNITGRTNWNYVKTIDCNIHGYIPQKDCIEIKNMFNAGVTFWHNPTTFLDYSQSNTIVS